MNQFGLIIQETTAGSGQQFVSAHLDVDNPEIKETITDERFIATQLANLSDVYSVQITKNYKVYSLIVTDLADFLGRTGYYAIRLYGPKGVNLTNFENILASIKEKYNSYSKSNTLNIQNYDAILSSILIIENERKNFISLKSDVNCFYYFEETNTALSTVFNTKGINLVHKVYAFNKGKALNESIAASLELKPYAAINSSQKEINIINSHSILKELKINNQTLDFNTNVSDFNLLCQSNDLVFFNTTDDKIFKQIDNNFISIERKYNPRSVTKPNSYSSNGRKKKTFWEENGIYLGILLLTIMLVGGSWWLLGRESESSNVNNEQTTINKTDEIKELVFEIDVDNNDTVYITNYPKLEKYRFKYDNKKWSYKNKEGKDPYEDFFKETIDDIIKNDSLNKNDFKKDEFIKKLEEKSSHKVENKENLEEDTKKPEKTSSKKSDNNSEDKRESVDKKVPNNKETEKKAAPREKPDGSNI